MNRRAFFHSGLAGIIGTATGAGSGQDGAEQTPWHLLRDPRLQHIDFSHGVKQRMDVFLDKRSVHDVMEMIAIPKPCCPANGAVRCALRNFEGQYYIVGDRVAAEWRFGMVQWRWQDGDT